MLAIELSASLCDCSGPAGGLFGSSVGMPSVPVWSAVALVRLCCVESLDLSSWARVVADSVMVVVCWDVGWSSGTVLLCCLGEGREGAREGGGREGGREEGGREGGRGEGGREE